MELDDEIQKTFLKIRPICVEVMNYINWASLPKIDNRLINFYEVIRDIKNPEILIPLEDYICFPLIQILNDKNTSQQNSEQIFKILSYIVENVRNVLSVDLFQNFLVVSSKYASQESNSEELKYAAIHCILLLIKCYPNREELILKSENFFKKKNIINVNDLNNKVYKMIIPHIISICLEIVEKEKLLILRLEVLEILGYLIDILEYTSVIKFVPGIVSNLLKTCVNSSKDNHRILVNLLAVLKDVICKAYNDNVNSNILKQKDAISWSDLKNISNKKNKSIDARNNKLIKEEITEEDNLNKLKKNKIEAMFDEQDKVNESVVTEEWVNISAVKILNLLNVLNKIRGHAHQNVRKQFVIFAKKIICDCKVTLQICLDTLVEILVYYLNDEIEEISTICQEAINEVSSEFKDNQQFLELLKKNFEKLILSFPRVLTTSNDSTKFEMINLANGYLILLKDEATVLIQTSIEFLISSLIEILTFDVSDIRLIEDRYNYNNNQVDIVEVSKTSEINGIDSFLNNDQLINDENILLNHTYLYNQYSKYFPKKNFKYIHDEKVTKVLSQLCHLIGYYGNISFLVDYILNTYIINNNYTDNTISPIYLLNEVCIGGFHRLNDKRKRSKENKSVDNEIEFYFNILENVLFEYTHSKILDMPTSLIDENLMANLDLMRAKNNLQFSEGTFDNKIESFNEIIIKNCLILEGISVISLIMRDNFKIHLMETLYILLEKLGDINRTISDLAMSCINLVSKACNYSNPSELILDNVDYIINIITQKLRYIEYNIKAPRVLKAAIEVSKYPIIQYMNDTIEELCEILDQNKNNSSLGCLVIDVFQALMNVLNKYSIFENVSSTISKIPLKENKSNDIKDKEKIDSSQNSFIEQITKSAIFQQADPEIQSFFLKNISMNDSNDEQSEEKSNNKSKLGGKDKEGNINEIEDYFKDYLKKKEEKNNFENEHALEEDENNQWDKNEDEKDNLGDEENEVSNMSYDQKLCLRVVKETSYYINSDSPELRSKSLRVIKASFQMLGHYPKELYPMVHQLWPTLLNRLNDPANHVIKDTIQLINEMITTTSIGADFLNRAVANELLPILFRFMEKYNANIMPIEVFKKSTNTKRRRDFEKVKYQKDSTSLFGDDVILVDNKESLSDIEIKNKHSNINKLQISILEMLSFIICSLEKDHKGNKGSLKLEEYHQLEKLLLPSLSSDRNIEIIQKKAIQLFKNICLSDEDGVWLIMSSLKGIIQEYKLKNDYNDIEKEKQQIQNNLYQLFNISDIEDELKLNLPLGWKKEIIYMNNINRKNRKIQQLIENEDEDIRKMKENKYLNWIFSMQKNIQIILSYIS
ncbi:hypothetical protein BCR36DRAFT_405357 [Piromyces finnis]|uniref:ARM repeat-containing protein n=1 Tax=Piromyces finnis TaxID=1754191 RepID=A0A1Y1V4W4_9FUNG|nr:hypothetical protein BCR36DRAFT_405357 [Piromyces finnis]|eukprot:ORX47279.1 hypothetical protein BCR36DRAFT_405357 [Piromyces finnis]